MRFLTTTARTAAARIDFRLDISFENEAFAKRRLSQDAWPSAGQLVRFLGACFRAIYSDCAGCQVKGQALSWPHFELPSWPASTKTQRTRPQRITP